jgi:hypothetical protein
MIGHNLQGYRFDRVSILRSVPPESGVYAIYREGRYIYVGDGADIQAMLLAHLDGDNDCITRGHPTGFAFELLPEPQRVSRRNTLIVQLVTLMPAGCNRKLDLKRGRMVLGRARGRRSRGQRGSKTVISIVIGREVPFRYNLVTMDITAILNELREQRDQLERAIAALESTNGRSKRAYNRKSGKRTMSAEARAKIAAAAKKRWAAAKKAGKSTLAA